MDPELLRQIMEMFSGGGKEETQSYPWEAGFNLGTGANYQPSGMGFGKQGPRPQFPNYMFQTAPPAPLFQGGGFNDSSYLPQAPQWGPPRLEWGRPTMHTVMPPMKNFPQFRPGLNLEALMRGSLFGDHQNMGDWMPVEHWGVPENPYVPGNDWGEENY